MNADQRLAKARTSARRRLALQRVLPMLPWIAVAVLLAWRLSWMPWTLAPLVLALAFAAWRAIRGMRSIDDVWSARRLDAQRADMEDSASLLFVADGTTTHIADLQRARLRQRIERGPALHLRTPMSTVPLAVACAGALLAALVIVLWPEPGNAPGAPAQGAAAAETVAPPSLADTELHIQPPAYTGLPARSAKTLDARVPVTSTLRWSLRFSRAPTSATLEFRDGSKTELRHENDSWIAERRIDAPSLYRIVTTPALPQAQAGLHRVDAIADKPPRVRALAPDRNLSVRTAGQTRWALRFEADDDYGVAANARLLVTQTVGSGENIKAKRQTLVLRGSGSTTRRTFARTLDLGALGLVAGDDLIVQLEVNDNRAPSPQRTRSPSFILRWPPEQADDDTGLDGLVKQAIPAALRSQRQVIIDAEALQKQKPKLAAERFVQRSDAIGVDQRGLRMRYGQFLGEESEGRPIMPTNDAGQAKAQRDAATSGQADAASDGHDDHHAGEAPAPPAKFGEEGDVLEAFGHVHDQAGVATMLDPDTKSTLRNALTEMWQSELQLRQGRPDLALPFAYRALGFIKQVQQASRVYLQRTGIQPPPIDESRRLGGDRKGLADRRDLLAQAKPADDVPGEAWRALAATVSDATRLDNDQRLDALEQWVHDHPSRVEDPLSLAVAIDALRRQPACEDCRTTLRARLWPLLAPPRGGIDARPRADDEGRAYLDALLQMETTP